MRQFFILPIVVGLIGVTPIAMYADDVGHWLLSAREITKSEAAASPDNARLLVAIAIVEINNGDNAAAEADLKSAEKQGPGVPELVNGWGLLPSWDSAEAALLRCPAGTVRDTAGVRLVHLLGEAGEFDRAKNVRDRFLSKAAMVQANRELAVSLTRAHRLDDARAVSPDADTPTPAVMLESGYDAQANEIVDSEAPLRQAKDRIEIAAMELGKDDTVAARVMVDGAEKSLAKIKSDDERFDLLASEITVLNGLDDPAAVKSILTKMESITTNTKDATVHANRLAVVVAAHADSGDIAGACEWLKKIPRDYNSARGAAEFAVAKAIARRGDLSGAVNQLQGQADTDERAMQLARLVARSGHFGSIKSTAAGIQSARRSCWFDIGAAQGIVDSK